MGTTAEELRRELSAERSSIGADLEAIGDRVSPGRMVERRKAATRRRLTTIRERVMGSADDLSGALTAPVSGALSSASGAASSIAGAVSDTPTTMRRTTRGNPLGAGLIAFGVGLVVATLLPETDAEKRWAENIQPELEQVASSAGHAANEVVEAIKPAAQSAAANLKEDAAEAVQHVKQQTAEAASIAADQASDAVQAGTDR